MLKKDKLETLFPNRRKDDLANIKDKSRELAEEYSRDLDEYEKKNPEVKKFRVKKTKKKKK